LAAPELKKYGFSALFNVTTGYIGKKKLLWTKELDEIVLGWRKKTIPTPENKSDITMPLVLKEKIGIAEHLRSCCKKMSDEEREVFLNDLGSKEFSFKKKWHEELYEFMTWDEVRNLSSQGFEIGSHTINHPILTQLPEEKLKKELQDSKTIIEQKLDKECSWIAYPNGGIADVSPQIYHKTKKAGYKIGLTLMGSGFNNTSPNTFIMDRICIGGQEPRNLFLARTSNFLNNIRQLKNVIPK